ncbi:hypothetical protein [Archaeoglobus sp.]
MCASVSISMAPALSLGGILPSIVLSVLTGIAGIVLVVKGLAKPGGV